MSSATRAAIVAASMSSQTIGFIGCGNMATAMIDRILKADAGFCTIRVFDVDETKTELFVSAGSSSQTGVAKNEAGLCSESDVIVLAVKPQAFNTIADKIESVLANEDKIVISIMAGVRIGTIETRLGHNRIVRVMPNLGAQVGEGVSVWYTKSNDVADTTVDALLNPLGLVVKASDEDQLDKLSAISGCGPGYVFLFMEALQDAAVALGIPLDVARRVAVQTVLGSSAFARDNAQHLAQLKSMVTSPGGTTAAGLSELERGGLRTAVQDAVEAAYDQGTFLSDSVTK